MIFYFSGTGNSKWIAEELAKQINDTAIDLITVAKPLSSLLTPSGSSSPYMPGAFLNLLDSF